MSAILPIMERHAPDVKERMRAFDAWDLEQRRLAGPLGGLAIRFPHGNLHISRHWPHLLCWQWIFSWQPPCLPGQRRFFEVWRLGPGAAGGEHIGVRLLWLGQFVYHRQASDRIAALGPIGRTAPVIFEKRLSVRNDDE